MVSLRSRFAPDWEPVPGLKAQTLKRAFMRGRGLLSILRFRRRSGTRGCPEDRRKGQEGALGMGPVPLGGFFVDKVGVGTLVFRIAGSQ